MDSLAPASSKAHALQRLRDAGLDLGQVLGMLGRIEVIPVFTAHPTDVARRVVHFKQRRIARELERLDRLPLTDGEAMRDDENYSYAAAWEFKGDGQPAALHKEPLTFEYVHPSQRSYK